MCIYHYTESLPKKSVIARKTVSVTNREETIEWKECGLKQCRLKLHVPKNSLPADLDQTNVTMIISQSDSCNQAEGTQPKGYISYELQFIKGKQPKGLTLEICRDTVDTPQSQG